MRKHEEMNIKLATYYRIFPKRIDLFNYFFHDIYFQQLFSKILQNRYLCLVGHLGHLGIRYISFVFSRFFAVVVLYNSFALLDT